MRIFISAPRFEPARTLGGEAYFRSFLRALSEVKNEERVAVLASEKGCEWGEKLAKSFEWIPQSVSNSKVKRIIHERNNAEKTAGKWQADVVLFPFNYMPRFRLPNVLIVHDLVNEFYCRQFPRFRPVYYRIMRYIVRRSINRAAAIVTMTNATRNEMYRHRLIKPKQIVHLAPLSAEMPWRETRRPSSLASDGRQLILQSGDHLPHKNHLTGILAMAELRQNFPEVFKRVQMVLTCGFNRDQKLKELVERKNLNANVSFIGKLPNEELEWLMQNAALFSFPTLHEGFGLGVVEAQLRRLPVVASDLPVLREVSGGAAAFFEPSNHVKMAETMATLLTDESYRQNLTQQGFENVKRWSWTDNAQKVLAVLRSTALNGKKS